MVEIDSVDLSFDGREILSGCFLRVEKGEVVGLLGRNGSGKSSLLKIIFGSLKANFKHLRIDSKIVHKAYLSGQVCYLPQDSFLPRFLTVKKILGYRGNPSDFSGPEILKDVLNNRVGELSGGELRILECFWILSQRAPYILLDEPFSGISPIHIPIIQNLINEKKKEKGVILTDHTYRPLLEISDRIVLLHNNSIYSINSENDLAFYQYIPGI